MLTYFNPNVFLPVVDKCLFVFLFFFVFVLFLQGWVHFYIKNTKIAVRNGHNTILNVSDSDLKKR